MKNENGIVHRKDAKNAKKIFTAKGAKHAKETLQP